MNRSEEKPLPFEAIKDKLNKDKKYKTCLHPDASPKTCNSVISAHTIQMSRVLKEITDSESHFLSFYPFTPTDDKKLKVHRIGWKKASTFTAFCSFHDENTFSTLEKKPFYGSRGQIFLIAYRAICWELYQKITVLKASPSIKENVDRGLPLEQQKFVQMFYSIQDAGYSKGMEDLKSAKSEMDEILLGKQIDNSNIYEVILNGPLSIAATGSITPNRSISGESLQILHDPKSKIQWLAFGLDIYPNNNISFVFIWSKYHSAPQRYIYEVDKFDDTKLSEFLSQFLFAYCENTYFSSAWWNSLSIIQQEHVMELMFNTNPYYYIPKINFELNISPWKVVKREYK